MESQVLKDEVLLGAESDEQPAEQMSERHDHVKNVTETSRIQLCAKSFILQLYDVLARHSSPLVSIPPLGWGFSRHRYDPRLSPQHGCVPAEPASVSPGKIIVAPPRPSVSTVAVGTTISDRPPPRSVRARLRIRLLRRMGGVEACIGIGVQNAGWRNPPVQDWGKARPTHLCALTTADQNALP